ncbi:hypothetical protein QJS10_CPB11g02240 [Acorus calamus]|uniref:Uncharacterized protein n=1 Tax=Acorus calamus TaxID=4465 RepID=A0AAV9DVK4_ACOCL|nr:hypothetical protein QJS10_CPB11g02240 [Acorus calamus]
MAQEGSPEASMTTNTSTSNWWELHARSHLPYMHPWHPQNPNSNNSSCDEDISISTTSFTNASNHSGLSVDSSTEPVMENHLWSQVLLSVGSGGDLASGHGEKFLESLSSKGLSGDIFEPACNNYLKKLDNNWEFTQSASLQSLEKHLNGDTSTGSFVEHERLTTNLSDLVSNWSIAPPEPQTTPSTCQVSVNSPMFRHEIKEEESQHQVVKPFGSYSNGYQMGLNNVNEVRSYNNKCYPSGMSDAPWSNNMRSFSDLISFNGCLNKLPVEARASKPCSKGLASPTIKKQGHDASSSTRGTVRGTGLTSEGKKKRSEDNSEALVKKSKHENSAVSSPKTPPPKVKLADKITVLQQIVSPFGKLFSNPYMKAGANKDHINNAWGGLERKDKTEPKLDLKSRGLCLVPISCTPQVYRDNSGPDYWTPTYRGCLYR